MNVVVIEKGDSRYPAEFMAIGDDAPERIYALGNVDLLSRMHKIAIVGSRKASREGLSSAYSLGAKYARQGTVVVSGLALGCDAAAHRGCLDAGGETIAIVATGLNLVHPKENIPLQEQILLRGGLIISEQPIGTKANPTRLVARNRLQAALSERVIVAECPMHSGTMHTVGFAKKYGKLVTAVRYSRPNDFNTGNAQILLQNGTEEKLK